MGSGINANQGFDAMEYNTDHEYWKQRTGGRWWIEGQSYDDDLVNYIDKWLYHWVNYVEETVFDVNMLLIDKNPMLYAVTIMKRSLKNLMSMVLPHM